MIHVLAVDDDADIRGLVAVAFGKPDYALEFAEDGQKALECLDARVPDLVITDVMMPRIDGWTLVRTLRSRPATSLTPVIFLTTRGSSGDRLRGFQLGADDYVPKPFATDDLEARARNVLQRAGRLRTSTREGIASAAGMRGDLAELNLSSILMMLQMESSTGMLGLDRGGESARLLLQDGRVVQASDRGNPRREGAECVYHLLTWADGTFQWTVREIPVNDSIGMPTAQLLREATRRMNAGQAS